MRRHLHRLLRARQPFPAPYTAHPAPLRSLQDGVATELTDGFAFIGMMRRNHPEADVTVIIYSVNHSPDVLARAKSMGAAAVVDKKAGVNSLLLAVRAALDERKKKQAPAPAPSCLAW